MNPRSAGKPVPPKGKPHLLDYTLGELQTEFAKSSLEAYRTKQVCDWIFKTRALSFADMSNLPQASRDALEKKFQTRKLPKPQKSESTLDPTVKLIFNVENKQSFSCVFLPHLTYSSLCISTQVGCAFKCQFCASGLVPFQRNLSSGEILDQIFYAEEATGKKIQNILFMGMGEPLANYEGTVRTIRWMTSPSGLAMNPKRITVSTTGLAPQIKKLGFEKLKVNLALSLHASNDKLRKKIMPVSSNFEIRDVLSACRSFQSNNDSDFTIEYILLDNVNDSLKDAEELTHLLWRQHYSPQPKINLIPYNPVPGLPYKAPERERVNKFFNYLKSKKFIVHSRKPQGQDIGAACGQLS